MLLGVLLEDVNGSACNRASNYAQKIKITNTCQYLYFQIQIWNNFNDKINNLVINSLLVATFKDNDNSYILNFMIFHQGPSMDQAIHRLFNIIINGLDATICL
jgi:hypothetical protein